MISEQIELQRLETMANAKQLVIHVLQELYTVFLAITFTLSCLFSFYGQRFLRMFVDYACEKFFGFLFTPQQGLLPPITNALLLEPAHSLVDKIRSGQLKSEELVNAYIERAREVQPFTNAYIQNRFEDALEEAREVDRRVQEELNGEPPRGGKASIHSQSLLGIPFSAKDSIGICGMYWTAGMLDRKGYRSRDDSIVIKNVRAAGAIPIAMTNGNNKLSSHH